MSLGSETSQLVSNLSSFETAAATSRMEQGALQAQKFYYQSQLEEGRLALPDDMASMNSSYISQLENDIATLESTRGFTHGAGFLR